MAAEDETHELTPRDRDVLARIAAGRTNAEIADDLGMTFATAKWYVSSVLAKLGVDSREDAARWWRRQRSPLRRLRRAVLIPMPPLAWATFAAGSVALMLVAIVVAVRGTPGPLASAPAPANTQPATTAVVPAPTLATPAAQLPPVLPVSHSGEQWSVALAPGVTRLDGTVVTSSDGADPTIRFFDLATRRWLAELHTAYNPFIAMRASAGQLIVADDTVVGGIITTKRLLVFDLRNALALVAEGTVPERVNTPGGLAPMWMTLSRDEQFLFYVTSAQRTDPPSCAAGGDAAVCALMSVAVVDLTTLQPVGPKVDMPRGCAPWLAAVDAGVVVTCNVISYGTPAGQVFLIDSTLRLTTLGAVDLPFEQDPVIARNRASARLAWSDGVRRGYLSSEGTFVRVNADESVASAPTIPPGKRPLLQPVALANGRLGIPYATRYYDQAAEGIAVFNPLTMQIERDIQVSLLSSLVLEDSGIAVGLTDSGELVTVDLQSGATDAMGVTLGVGQHFLID
jgi:DNA-binding CsgD family transcriptional regulator